MLLFSLQALQMLWVREASVQSRVFITGSTFTLWESEPAGPYVSAKAQTRAQHPFLLKLVNLCDVFFFSRCLYSLNHPSCYLPKQNPNWFDKLLALRLSKPSKAIPSLPDSWSCQCFLPSHTGGQNAQALTFPSLLLPLTGGNAVFTHPLHRNPL